MLNELLLIEKGMQAAGIRMAQRHPDIGDAAKKRTLVVRLDANGNVSDVYPLPPDVTPWTMRNGKHNSFPFVNLSIPLKRLDDAERESFAKIKKKDAAARYHELKRLTPDAPFDGAAFSGWPGDGILNSLKTRMPGLKTISSQENAYVVPATVKRFLLTVEIPDGGKALLKEITQRIVDGFQHNSQSDWIDLAAALLIGKKGKTGWESEGAVLFEAQGFSSSIFDSSLVEPLSMALYSGLSVVKNTKEVKADGVCALTGAACELHEGNYPQPTLPAGLGPSYLCAVKNTAIPASGRYRRFASEAIPVGRELIVRIDAAIRELTTPERKNVTWRSILGEAPKKNDLLLAFVRGCPDAPVAAVLADTDDEDDFSQEESSEAEKMADSIALYEQRTQRVIDAVKAKLGDDFTQTPVDLLVLRKLDPANRKAIYSQSFNVGNLKAAADAWAKGERMLPTWHTMPLYRKMQKALEQTRPPHISPLGLIGFCRKMYLRGGKDGVEAPGVPAAEALHLFLDVDHSSKMRITKFLNLVLTRRSALVSGSAHALRLDQRSKKEERKAKKFVEDYDLNETLRTATVLGVLLYKFYGKGINYMENAAFKLGQLLAAADMVHLGYCESVRGGQVPPSLLGNQVLSTASSHPNKALSMLCQRWKPYAGWAKKASHDKTEKQDSSKLTSKDWNIKKALRYAREAEKLAAELEGELDSAKVNDAFRAELLLGYMAGLPPAEKKEADKNGPSVDIAQV